MKSGKSKGFSLIFVLIMILLTVWLIFQNNDWATVVATFSSLQPIWLFAAIACWAAHVAFDALTLYLHLKHQKYPISFRFALYVTVTGSFYCAITPGASGGQPMQIYHLSQKHVPVGVSTSAMSIKFVIGQATTVLVTLLLWIFNHSFIQSTLSGVKWLIVIGWLVHLGGVVLILLITFCKSSVHRLALWLIKQGARWRIIKDSEAAASKIHDYIESYHASNVAFGRNPKELLRQSILSCISLLLVMMIPVCIYHAFGMKGCRLVDLLTVAYMLYLSASYNPLPGASGAQEGGFLVFFRDIFPTGQISIAMFVWRVFTYYVHLIAGAFLLLIQTIISFKHKQKRLPKEDCTESCADHECKQMNTKVEFNHEQEVFH